MKTSLQQFIARRLVRPGIGLILAGAIALPALARDDAHYIYTLDNSVTDNHVLVIRHNADGTLSGAGAVSTGGKGTGSGLGSQGSLALSDNGRWLFAVSAATNQVSTFAVDEGELRLASIIASGGTLPVSVTSHGKIVYVLNAGGAGNITGFEVTNRGALVPIPGSTQGIGAAGSGPAEVKFTHDGEHLVVSEKAANQLLVFDVDDGLARLASVNPSAGAVPFGFDIDRRDQVIVSEAFAGDVSSYELRERSDTLALVTASAHTYQGAPCWLILTPNNRYAYTGNAASGTITGFGVNYKGVLSLLQPNGLSASTGAGSHTTDLATSEDGRFLYALANTGQTVNAFRIAHDGSLSPAGVFAGVPTSAVGLVAR